MLPVDWFYAASNTGTRGHMGVVPLQIGNYTRSEGSKVPPSTLQSRRFHPNCCRGQFLADDDFASKVHLSVLVIPKDLGARMDHSGAYIRAKYPIGLPVSRKANYLSHAEMEWSLGAFALGDLEERP